MCSFKPRTSVKLQDHVIHLIDRVDGLQLIPVSDIVVLGESTNTEGPDFDDWFLSVATRDTWFDIPVTSNGFDSFLKELGATLRFVPELSLGGPTCNSRILWPSDLESQEMFKYQKSWLGLSSTQTYTENVKTYIEQSVRLI